MLSKYVKLKYKKTTYYFNENVIKTVFAETLDYQSGTDNAIPESTLLCFASFAICDNKLLKCRLSLEDILDIYTEVPNE